ncbi:MAG: hypothetical protein VXU50_07395, partial [Verrucomicrobiota bacterium]|nr:hypothetical protein [Verrucomicrobiota bacterium]
MPEFEEENVNASPSESYAPSTDASKKPRTRRRSGGFKTEVASLSNASIGEVNANQAFKEEKLSGTPSATQSRKTCESHGDREDRPCRERKPRESRAPRKPRTDANPQPSPETLAAIASVEAKIAERRAERDARRAERDKPRTAQTKPNEHKPRKQVGGKPAPKKGLLASILSIFGLGPKAAPAKKRGGNRGGRSRGKGGNRGGQNRR